MTQCYCELYIGNTISVRLIGLAVRGVAISDATVTATLEDSSGAPVAGAEDISMPAVTGSAGEYEGFIPDTVPLIDQARYIVHVRASKVGKGIGDWRPVRVARYRGDS